MVKEVLQNFFIFLLVVIVSHEVLVLLILDSDQVFFFRPWLISLAKNNLFEHDAIQIKTTDTITESALYLVFNCLKKQVLIQNICHAPLDLPDLLIDAVDVLHFPHLFLLVHACDRQRVYLSSNFEDPLDELRQYFSQVLDQPQLKCGQTEVIKRRCSNRRLHVPVVDLLTVVSIAFKE